MERNNYTGVTDEEFQAAVNALCDEQQGACDHAPGCRCVDAQTVAGGVVWTVLAAVHEHRKKA